MAAICTYLATGMCVGSVILGFGRCMHQCVASNRCTSCSQKSAKTRKISGKSLTTSLHLSQSPCSVTMSGRVTWLICAHQQLQQSHSHRWRHQLGHVKWRSPSISPYPLQRLHQLCLCSTTTGLGQGKGWPAELLRPAYQEVYGNDGKVLRLQVLTRPHLDQHNIPDEVNSSFGTLCL